MSLFDWMHPQTKVLISSKMYLLTFFKKNLADPKLNVFHKLKHMKIPHKDFCEHFWEKKAAQRSHTLKWQDKEGSQNNDTVYKKSNDWIKVTLKLSYSQCILILYWQHNPHKFISWIFNTSPNPIGQ